MSKKIFVTKDYLNQQREKLSLLKKQLAEVIQEKKNAYDDDTNTWHDNFAHENAVRMEKSINKQIAESMSDLNNMEICNCLSGSCDIVNLWSKLKIIETNLATKESVKKSIVIVPMGADNVKENIYNYLSPYVSELIGKKHGDTVEIKLPRGRFELEIIKIRNMKEKSLSSCIIPFRDGKVAFLKYCEDGYGPIGGRVEDGEDIYQALRRELTEELGPESVILADNATYANEAYSFKHTDEKQIIKRGALSEEHHFFVAKVPKSIELEFIEICVPKVEIIWITPEELVTKKFLYFDNLLKYYKRVVMPIINNLKV